MSLVVPLAESLLFDRVGLERRLEEGARLAEKRKVRARLSRSDRTAEIMAVAREVIAESNGGDFAMSEIAERIGVVEGAIYRIFPTKHQLVIAVICDWYQEVMESYEAGLDKVSGVKAQLQFVCSHHIDCIYRYPELVNVFFSSLRMSGEYSGSGLHKMNRRYANRVIRILSDGALTGELRRDKSPKLGRDILFGAIEQATWGYRMGRADLDPGAIADNIADLVYDAYACVPQATGVKDEVARQLVSISDQLRRLAEDRKS